VRHRERLCGAWICGDESAFRRADGPGWRCAGAVPRDGERVHVRVERIVPHREQGDVAAPDADAPDARLSHHVVDIDYEAVIDAAWDHRVVPLLAARKILDEDVISDEALVPLHALACVLHVVEADPRFSTDFIQRLREQYDKTMDTTFSRIDFAVRDQTDLTPRSSGGEPRWGVMRATR